MVLQNILQDATKSYNVTIHNPIQARYDSADGIILFVREVIGVERVHGYQERALRKFYNSQRFSLRSGRGAGKSTIFAWFILWAVVVLSDDTIITTIAPSWGQLKNYLWREIHKWARQANWGKVDVRMRPGYELLTMGIKLPGVDVIAIASENAHLTEGGHAANIVYIFDEAKSIKIPIWDAAEGSFSGGEVGRSKRVYVAATSTPGKKTGRFYDICNHRVGYDHWVRERITLEEAIEAGQVSREWAETQKAAWGESSAAYQNYVLGDFADSGENSLIPLSWLEAGVARWYDRIGDNSEKAIDAYRQAQLAEGALERFGLDPAGEGNDMGAIAHIVGQTCLRIHECTHRNSIDAVGEALALLPNKHTPIGIDNVGLGDGTVYRLQELEYAAILVDFRTSAKDEYNRHLTDYTGARTFFNMRAYCYWMVRDRLDPFADYPEDEMLALPDDTTLIGDLAAQEWRYKSEAGGAIILEGKDTVRNKIGRSPDRSDALTIAHYAYQPGGVIFG